MFVDNIDVCGMFSGYNELWDNFLCHRGQGQQRNMAFSWNKNEQKKEGGNWLSHLKENATRAKPKTKLKDKEITRLRNPADMVS